MIDTAAFANPSHRSRPGGAGNVGRNSGNSGAQGGDEGGAAGRGGMGGERRGNSGGGFMSMGDLRGGGGSELSSTSFVTWRLIPVLSG